jgi:F0F1-type ATP synthase gamma subunit
LTSEFQEILANYREFDRFGAEIQNGNTEAFLRDEGWRKRVAAFMDLSDIRALEEIHKIIATVVDIMPCASSQGVNIFSTIAAHHSNVTGNPTLSHIIDLINKETSKNPAYESDEDP